MRGKNRVQIPALDIMILKDYVVIVDKEDYMKIIGTVIIEPNDPCWLLDFKFITGYLTISKTMISQY